MQYDCPFYLNLSRTKSTLKENDHIDLLQKALLDKAAYYGFDQALQAHVADCFEAKLRGTAPPGGATVRNVLSAYTNGVYNETASYDVISDYYAQSQSEKEQLQAEFKKLCHGKRILQEANAEDASLEQVRAAAAALCAECLEAARKIDAAADLASPQTAAALREKARAVSAEMPDTAARR